MKKGFTLIELLIVITIIGVLSGIGITVYQGVTAKARDNIRKQDLRTLATALELYYQQPAHTFIQNIQSCNTQDSSTFYLSINSYISTNQAPQDPITHQNYCYITVNNGQGYRLFTKLEKPDTNDTNYLNCTSFNWTLTSDNLSDKICPPN